MCNPTIKESIKRFKLIFLCLRNAYSFATTIYLTYVLYWSSYLRKGFEWGYIASIIAYVFLSFTFFFNFLYAIFMINLSKTFRNINTQQNMKVDSENFFFLTDLWDRTFNNIDTHVKCLLYTKPIDILIYFDSELVRSTILLKRRVMNNIDKESRTILKNKSYCILLISFILKDLTMSGISIKILSDKDLTMNYTNFNTLKNSAFFTIIGTIASLIFTFLTIAWKICKIKKRKLKENKNVELIVNYKKLYKNINIASYFTNC